MTNKIISVPCSCNQRTTKTKAMKKQNATFKRYALVFGVDWLTNSPYFYFRGRRYNKPNFLRRIIN